MSDSFEMQKRYFQVQLDRGMKKPGIHKNLIEDCRHYLKALDDTGSPAAFKEYVQQTGNMLSSAKANARDRYENRAFIYEILGSQKKVEADRLRLKVVDEAGTHQELSQNLETIQPKAGELEQQENKAIGAVSSIIKAVFHLATDPKGSGAQKRSITNFNTYWKMLKEADPGADWSKLMSYPPYRNRIIFTDGQLEVLKKIFEEVKNG